MRYGTTLLLLASLILAPLWAWAASDSFPAYEAAPAYTTYFADGTSFGMVGSSTHPNATAWGAVYNNIFYVDDPGEYYNGSDATGTGYWTWVDYNAYASSAAQAAFENANGGSWHWTFSLCL